MTVIGVIFIILSILWFRNINKLTVLLIISAIFEAATIFNASGGDRSIGLQPYYYVLLIIFVHYALKINFFNRLRIQSTIFFFLLYSLVVTVIASAIFSHILVYTPSKGIDITDISTLTPLTIGLSNFVQIMYLALNVSVYTFIINDQKIKISSNKVFRNVGIIAIIFGLLQIILPFISIAYPYTFTNNNLGFAQGYNQSSRLLLYRTVSSFIEPSSAGSYFASLFIFSFVLIVKKIGKFYINGAIAVFSALIVFTSASSTGILTLLVSMAAFIVYSIIDLLKSKKISFITIAAYASLASITTASAVLIPQVAEIFQDSILNKSSTNSFDNRGRSNIYSVDILSQSYGLGVGIGSNRPSGFFFYLLSNTGVIGTLLFFAFLASLLFTLLSGSGKPQSKMEISKSQPLMWAFLAILLSKIIAQPDLSQPSFWILILLLGIRINQTRHDRNLRGGML
ncbi:hypothetical protein [Deinococcus altitudinis]|uniref:hypothetical protein n=1 Tax=Deinococcus altitudinis TaxID=468914 RepID=UPI003892930A